MEINISFNKPCQITKYLNETLLSKKSGKPYDDQDIEGYMNRGWLPRCCGEVKVSETNAFDNRIITLSGDLEKKY